MKQLAPDLWIFDAKLRFFGLEVGARMTVVRLQGGKLLLHSPIRFERELARELEELGTVTYLIAPNRFHHLFVAGWREAYPGAGVFVAPGVEKKQAGLSIDALISNAERFPWQHELDHVALDGIPGTNEVVFFERASKTLITTDLVFNMTQASPPLTRAVFRVGGGYGKVGPTLLERFFVRDRAVFRQSLEEVLSLPFERIVMAHGEVSEAGGRGELASGYSWVLER